MLQALPLDVKIEKTKRRVIEWVEEYGEDNVYVSFSGGKDSTVLLHIVRKMFPDVPAVFSNTGLEYPAIVRFVKNQKRVEIIRSEKNFKEIITVYGYPVIGKEVAEYVHTVRHTKGEAYRKNRLQRLQGTFLRKDGRLSQYNRPKYYFLLEAPFEISPICCTEMKKKPFNAYTKRTGKQTIMATMAEESRLREGKWLKNGCNSFKSKHPNSAPMSFWKEQDVLQYLYIYRDEILKLLTKEEVLEKAEEEGMLLNPWAECYGKIEIHVTKDELDGQISIQETLQDYRECEFCTTGCKRTGCIFCLFGITQDTDRILKVQKEEPAIADYVLRGGEFNEKGMWQPSRTGMGFWFVIKWLVAHGDLNIPFEREEWYEEKYGNERTKKLLERKK